jgi:hypothetical protein
MTLHDAHALSIGISRYQHIRALPEVHDAGDVAAALIDPALGGYPPDHVATLLDEAATRDGILAALDELAGRTRNDSTVLFYFSGHGGRATEGDRDSYYLMPVDARATAARIARTAISGDDLSARLRAIRAARMTVILDCCRAAGIAEPKDVDLDELDDVLSPDLPGSALSPLARGRGRVVLAASRADGYAYVVPGQRNGVFTHHLLEGLRGAAPGAGGVIRIFDLYHHVQQQVTRASRTQSPVFKAEVDENYPIALYRGGAAPAIVVPPAPDDHQYDAFVSYHRASPADRAWVEGKLVPRLEQQFKLRLCLRHRDFRPGHPLIREMERAIQRSRYTIAVFTPSYLEGRFEEFEALLAQHRLAESGIVRFLPIVARPCNLPLSVRALAQMPMLDLADDTEVEAGLDRLALLLREAPERYSGPA